MAISFFLVDSAILCACSMTNGATVPALREPARKSPLTSRPLPNYKVQTTQKREDLFWLMVSEVSVCHDGIAWQVGRKGRGILVLIWLALLPPLQYIPIG